MTKSTSRFHCSLRMKALRWLFLLVIFSIALIAQEKDKDKLAGKDAKEKPAPGQVKVEGKVHCGKPEPAHSLDVPDRSGHALMIEQRKCSWSEPLTILDGKTKDGVAVSFTEKMEGSLHHHGFEVDTLSDGEKLTMQTMSQIPAEKGPAEFRGRWGFMRGTGKYKGIKGGGTFQGKLDADNGFTLDLEGIYEPAAMAGATK
jgi:hypothetical protein